MILTKRKIPGYTDLLVNYVTKMERQSFDLKTTFPKH